MSSELMTILNSQPIQTPEPRPLSDFTENELSVCIVNRKQWIKRCQDEIALYAMDILEIRREIVRRHGTLWSKFRALVN